MELAERIIAKYFADLKKEIMKELDVGIYKDIVETECYKALREIRNILDDDTLEDPECFMKIEKIVRVFEEMGSSGGSRHDF